MSFKVYGFAWLKGLLTRYERAIYALLRNALHVSVYYRYQTGDKDISAGFKRHMGRLAHR
jgi:hypothetical protein